VAISVDNFSFALPLEATCPTSRSRLSHEAPALRARNAPDYRISAKSDNHQLSYCDWNVSNNHLYSPVHGAKIMIQQMKNLNNLTKQMSVYNIQFVNNIIFRNSLHIVFSECCCFVKNLSYFLYIASDTEQFKRHLSFVWKWILSIPRPLGTCKVPAYQSSTKSDTWGWFIDYRYI